MTMTTTAARFHKSTKPANTSPKLQLQSRSPHKHKLSFFIGIHSRCCCLFFTFLVGHSQLIYFVLFVLYDSLSRQRQLRAFWYDCIRLSVGSWLARPPEAKADRKAATISNFHFWSLSVYFGYLELQEKIKRLKKIFFFIASLSRNSFMTQCKHTTEENWNPPQKKRARREEKNATTIKWDTKTTNQQAKYAEHMFMSTNRPRHEISHFIFQFQCLNFLPRRERDWLRSVVIREREAAPRRLSMICKCL